MAATQDSQVETLIQMQFQHHFLMRPRSPKISSPPDMIGNISIMELIQEIHGSCLTTTILNGHQDHLNLGIKRETKPPLSVLWMLILHRERKEMLQLISGLPLNSTNQAVTHISRSDLNTTMLRQSMRTARK